MAPTLGNRERFTYLGLAFLAYLLVRHVFGPLAGLDGWSLAIAAYAGAIVVATAYLYWRLRPRAAEPPDGE